MAALWMEVFKTGTHTSGNGVSKTYTESDLQEMCAKYNGQKDHEAPLVIGHPATNGPAFGWTKELKVAGNKLLAFVDGITDEVIDAIKKQHYKKISIAIYGDNLLRHIGLLGANPPAVKGLAPVAFASDADFAEYAWATDEYRMPAVGRILSGLRDFFIEKFGLETADKVLDKDDINRLATPASEAFIPESEDPKFTQKQEEVDMEMSEVIAKINETVTAALAPHVKTFGDQYKSLETTVTQVADSVKTITETLADKEKKVTIDAKTAAFNEKVTAFGVSVESWIKDGKVLAAEKDDLIDEYSDLLKAEEVMNFAEGDVRPTAKMTKRIEARDPANRRKDQQFADGSRAAKITHPEDVPDNFKAFAEIDPAGVAMDKAIRIYMEKNKVDYSAAAEAYAQGKA